MSNFKYRVIFGPVAAVLVGAIVAAAVASDIWSQTLDWVLGRGEVVVNNTGDQEINSSYYELSFDKTPEGRVAARDHGADVTEKIADEGITLLKNDGTLPLAKGSKVTPFGYRYLNPIYGGTGSGRVIVEDYFSKLEPMMNEYFDINELMVNGMKNSKVQFLTVDGYSEKDPGADKGEYDGATEAIAEYNPNIYMPFVGDYKTGIVFIGREAGEGGDLVNKAYPDGTPHQLSLSVYEKGAIEFAKANCDKVIIVINTSNALELGDLENDPKVNSIVWASQPGSRGFKSLVKVLTGEVNPSGKTVDIYAKDAFSHPSTKNIGDHTYGNTDAKYVEYEEGIYVGYRYFETASDLGVIDYDESVVYPFGYGMNYDDDKLTQTLSSVEYNNGNVTVKGTITNASTSYDMKEVVQIYSNPAYNPSSGIEKATRNLVAFEKYEVKKGETKNFEITFSEERLLSYDYKGYYSTSGSYVLEGGDYQIILGKDSHNRWGDSVINVPATKAYTDEATKNGAVAVGKRSDDSKVASNLFPKSNAYMNGTDCVNLTRANMAGTAQTTSDGKTMPAGDLEDYNACDKGTLTYMDKIEAKFGANKPKAGANNGLTLSSYRGVDYDDPSWDALLDQVVYEGDGNKELLALIGKAAYASGALTSIGKPATTDVDGPQGLSKVSPVNAYMAEALLGATWNKQLAKEMGDAIGNEMNCHTRVGWYAPAMNIHRSPFAGRNYEYYSEDPFLSGEMATATVSAAGAKGVLTYIKHFAVNDQETNRKKICTWANEQTMREIYFRPFELCVKHAECTLNYNKANADGTFTYSSKTIKATLGVMSSMNSIGATFACMNYAMQQDMLRGEWGFQGSLLTDSLDTTYSLDSAVEGGTNLWLWYERNNFKDISNVTTQWAVRDAVHHIGYAYANSLIMNNVAPNGSVTYKTSPWRYMVLGIELALGAGALAIVGIGVYRTIDEKKHPEKYKKRGEKA
ncbi:MAG: glycoside hydrolase family 3 C-terminal domain-containing protein [Bacilli bacterium]|nr:glycoside hydrolase family 3 C-terminal domain-containing protein [Bacilli bacterium]